jgi:hypothetical protein
LIIFNIKIVKLPKKTVFSIILLAVIANILWLSEILLRGEGWRGLYWLKYIHIAPFLIGILFLWWLIIIDQINKNEKNIKDIVFYGITYTLFLLITVNLFKLMYGNLKVNNDWGWIFRELRENMAHYIFIIIIQMCVIFGINIIITKYEKIKITAKTVCLNIFSMIIIPLYAFLTSFVILNRKITFLIEELSLYNPIRAVYFDPIDWIKLGSMIFGFTVYECFYIAYLKNSKLSI